MTDRIADDVLQQALRRCESEPIHQLGLVQPHGLLLVVGPGPDHVVLQASCNIDRFFARSVAEVLGVSLADLVGPEQIAEIEAIAASEDEGPDASCLLYSVVGDEIMELQTLVHRGEGHFILEMEPIHQPYRLHEVYELFQPVRRAMWGFERGRSVVDVCQRSADLVRELTGFERVMVYRFDRNWDGEVIAESRQAAALSYLGNRFPAGDIPPQARALYTRNLLRLVHDAAAVPVAIEPPSLPGSDQPLDLSRAQLRAFSPVHVEYLRNMGVRASLSLSIILDGRLWGLIACHHPKPAFVPHPVREMLQFVGKMVSQRLANLAAGEALAQAHRQAEAMTLLMADLLGDEAPSAVVGRHADKLLALTGAGGLLLIHGGQHHAFGRVPDEAARTRLIDWLSGQPPADSLATDHLPALLPAMADQADVAAGLLAAPVSPEMNDALIWFRPEQVRTVRWAGRPDKDVACDAQGRPRISPRKSFGDWQEIWRGRSLDWPAEICQSGALVARTLVDAVRRRRAASD